MTFLAQYSPYPPYAEHPGKGKGPPHPVVPESPLFGFTLLALMLAIVGWRRARRQ